jgi:hypothetical protein
LLYKVVNLSRPAKNKIGSCQADLVTNNDESCI